MLDDRKMAWGVPDKSAKRKLPGSGEESREQNERLEAHPRKLRRNPGRISLRLHEYFAEIEMSEHPAKEHAISFSSA